MANLKDRVEDLELAVEELRRDAARDRFENAQTRALAEELGRVSHEFRQALYPLFRLGRTKMALLAAHVDDIEHADEE